VQQFTQRYFLHKKKFTLQADGLLMETHEPGGGYSRFIHYNDIGSLHKKRLYSSKKPRLLWYGGLLATLTLAHGILIGAAWQQIVLATGCLLVVAYLAYYFNAVTYILLDAGENDAIYILHNRPSEKAVLMLIDEIYARRRNYYREHYFCIHYENTRAAEASRIHWLLQENIISQSEYEVVMEEIEDKLK
jgi:hypothetical protein